MIRTTGQIIKARREELGMSQDELAEKVGYKSRSAINKIETLSGREPKTSMLKKFACALNCSVSYLMGWEESDPEMLASIMADPEIIEVSVKFSKLNPTNRDFVKSTIEMLLKKQEDA